MIYDSLMFNIYWTTMSWGDDLIVSAIFIFISNGETFVICSIHRIKRKYVFRNMQLHCEHVNNEYNCPFHVSFIV